MTVTVCDLLASGEQEQEQEQEQCVTSLLLASLLCLVSVKCSLHLLRLSQWYSHRRQNQRARGNLVDLFFRGCRCLAGARWKLSQLVGRFWFGFNDRI